MCYETPRNAISASGTCLATSHRSRTRQTTTTRTPGATWTTCRTPTMAWPRQAPPAHPRAPGATWTTCRTWARAQRARPGGPRPVRAGRGARSTSTTSPYRGTGRGEQKGEGGGGEGEDRAALVRGRQQRVLDAAAAREVVRVAGKVVALARDGKAAEARRAVRRRALPVHVRAVPAGVAAEDAAQGRARPAGLRHLRHGRGAPAGGHPARLKGQARDVAQKHALRFRRGAQRKEREDQPRAKNRHVEWRACRAPRRAA